MAFFSSHIDRQGNEIDRLASARSHSSFSTVSSTLTDGATLMGSVGPSSVGSVTLKNSSIYSGTLTLKDVDEHAREVNEKIQRWRQNQADECGNENAYEQTDTFSTDGSCTLYNSNSFGDMVPPLNLNFGHGYRTSIKSCEHSESRRRTDDAYVSWLTAKAKTLSLDAARRKATEEEKRRAEEERKLMAEEKYQQWLARKARVKRDTSKSPHGKTTTRSRIQVSPEEQQRRLEEWERVKREKIERERVRRRQEKQRLQHIEEQRLELSRDAWQNWVATSRKKPKPVPLNRGIQTLKGTVSNIFVNPNEWKSIIDD